MEFTPLERDVLNWIAKHTDDPIVARQLTAAQPIAREFTGVGSFTTLSVPSDLPRVTYRVHPLDPMIESPQLEHGGGCVLFFEDGWAETLELYAFGNRFPEQFETWKLSAWEKHDATLGRE